MQPLLLFLGVAVLAALNSVDAAVECYTCITDNPSWASAKCAGKTTTGCVFCTKATFGNSLVVRGCAKQGFTEAAMTGQQTMCKQYEKYFGVNWVPQSMKDAWKAKHKYYEQSCTATKNKEPHKGYTCKKKLCNAASPSQTLSSALFLGAVAVFGLRSYI